jgi:hypothetical protein
MFRYYLGTSKSLLLGSSLLLGLLFGGGSGIDLGSGGGSVTLRTLGTGGTGRTGRTGRTSGTSGTGKTRTTGSTTHALVNHLK